MSGIASASQRTASRHQQAAAGQGRPGASCGCRKPVPPGRMLCWPLVTRLRVRHMRVRSWPAGAWDDLRLVGLKLIFLIVTRSVSLLGLSRRDWWWKDAEIHMLRHQLAVAERERPRAHSRLTWPDRALLALLAGTLPIDRLAATRLIVTPGTILRWHRDIVRRRWSRRSRQGRTGRPATHRKVRSVVLRLARENESWGTAASTASWPGSASPWRRPRSGRSSRTPASIPRPAGRDLAGPNSCGPRRRGSWRWTSSPPTCSTERRSTSLPL